NVPDVEASFVKTSAGRVGAAKIGTADDPASPNLELFQKFSVPDGKFEKNAAIPWKNTISTTREIPRISNLKRFQRWIPDPATPESVRPPPLSSKRSCTSCLLPPSGSGPHCAALRNGASGWL